MQSILIFLPTIAYLTASIQKCSTFIPMNPHDIIFFLTLDTYDCCLRRLELAEAKLEMSIASELSASVSQDSQEMDSMKYD